MASIGVLSAMCSSRMFWTCVCRGPGRDRRSGSDWRWQARVSFRRSSLADGSASPHADRSDPSPKRSSRVRHMNPLRICGRSLRLKLPDGRRRWPGPTLAAARPRVRQFFRNRAARVYRFKCSSSPGSSRFKIRRITLLGCFLYSSSRRASSITSYGGAMTSLSASYMSEVVAKAGEGLDGSGMRGLAEVRSGLKKPSETVPSPCSIN